MNPFNFKTLMCYLAAAIFGILRFTLPVEGRIEHADIFKDLAHVFVGGLFGAAIAKNNDRCLWIVAVGLTVLEVVAFIVRKQ